MPPLACRGQGLLPLPPAFSIRFSSSTFAGASGPTFGLPECEHETFPGWLNLVLCTVVMCLRMASCKLLYVSSGAGVQPPASV